MTLWKILFHSDFFTKLNIKTFKGIKKQTVRDNHLTGKHYKQVLMISNAVKQRTVRYMTWVSTSPEGRWSVDWVMMAHTLTFHFFGMELLLMEVLVMMMSFMLPKYLSQKWETKCFLKKWQNWLTLPARSSTIQVRSSDGITSGILIVSETIFLSQIQITYNQWWDWVMTW